MTKLTDKESALVYIKYLIKELENINNIDYTRVTVAVDKLKESEGVNYRPDCLKAYDALNDTIEKWQDIHDLILGDVGLGDV